MLKKVGIITAGTTIGLLALSPVAMASGVEENESDAGLWNHSDNNGLFAGQGCNNNVPVNVWWAVQVPVQDIAGAIGLFGDVKDSTVSNDDSCDQKVALHD